MVSSQRCFLGFPQLPLRNLLLNSLIYRREFHAHLLFRHFKRELAAFQTRTAPGNFGRDVTWFDPWRLVSADFVATKSHNTTSVMTCDGLGRWILCSQSVCLHQLYILPSRLVDGRYKRHWLEFCARMPSAAWSMPSFYGCSVLCFASTLRCPGATNSLAAILVSTTVPMVPLSL